MKIFFEFPNKHVFAFRVSTNDKILNLKNEINKLFGSVLQNYILTYDDRILKDEKRLYEYKIEDKSLINADRCENRIFVETMNEILLGLELENLRVFELMKKVQEKIGIARDDQILIYDNVLLEDGGKLLQEFGISGNSVIRVLDRSSGDMVIFIKTLDGIRFMIEVQKSDKIIDIKYRIQDKVGLHPDEQQLVYQGEILEDDYKTIDEYQICEKYMINVFARLRNGIQIFAKTLDGKTITLKVFKSDKIYSIKKKIQYKTGWHPDEQRLVYQGGILDEFTTIGEYGICEKHTINVVTRLRSCRMEIFAKTMDGQTIMLEVDKSDKIYDIKKKIQSKIGLNPDELILFHAGLILLNDRTIDFYQIGHSTIHIINNLRGGGTQLFVNVIDAGTITICIGGSEKIIDIKYKIQEKTGLNRDEQKLIYQGEILDEEKTFDQYNISSNTIDFTSISNNKILIFAEIINGEVLTFAMPINSTISDMKNEINKKLELTINDEILIYHDNMSHDNDYSQLIYQYQSNMTLKLIIRTKYEKLFTIDSVNHENIREIMKSIKNKLKINAKYEKIIFNNKQLLTNDNKVIYSFGIEPRSKIDLDCELREFRLFVQSIKSGSFDDVKKYFRNEFLEKNYGSYLRYPIHYAVRYGHLEIINYLINQQCNIECADFENIRPIHYVCYYGAGEILKLFIENKCDLESSDLMKRRPIHFACYCGNMEIINLLIENRCELEIKDLLNQIPLKIVRKNKFFEFSKIIEEEIQKRKIDKISTAMNLQCTHQCDNSYSYMSFLRSLLTKKFEKDEKIGKGSFGKVYKCQESFTGKKFAVKIINRKTSMRKYIENNINNYTEILDHPRIIKYFGAVEKEKKLFIFMELLSGNSLQSKIKSRISAPKVIHYTKQLLEALKYLHERNIIHRDIKPENSLFDDQDNVKIVDFGLSVMLTKTNGFIEKAVTFCGTKEFMAPEIMNSDLYTCSVDIWSLGVSVIYMATGKMPFIKICPVIKIEYQLSESLPTYFKDLIGEMLIPDPEKRISAEHLLNKFEL